MLTINQLSLEKAAGFGLGNLKFGQGKVSEKSGNFAFNDLWEP